MDKVIKGLPTNKQLILFDGVCNLCNSSVQYIIKHDERDIFRFASLQSEVGLKIITHFKVDTAMTDSILLYTHEKGISIKSKAALKIASKLGFPHNLINVFWLVPPFFRNMIYDYIAKNRYKWYGKREHCMIPTTELKDKFLN